MRLITWEEIWITVEEVRSIMGKEKARWFLDELIEVVVFDDEGVWLPNKWRTLNLDDGAVTLEGEKQ
jgi:hypothetical protein